jgi:hypothetical protein
MLFKVPAKTSRPLHGGERSDHQGLGRDVHFGVAGQQTASFLVER